MNSRKTIEGVKDKEIDMKRKKKKRNKYKKDFYKFQLKGLEDFKELRKKTREDDLKEAMFFADEGNENEIDGTYLKKRKERLKAAFRDDVRKMMKR